MRAKGSRDVRLFFVIPSLSSQDGRDAPRLFQIQQSSTYRERVELHGPRQP